MTQYSGFSATTADRLILDAGAFYKNFDITTLTGTLLGATRGGGEFSAVPDIRPIEVDGVKGSAKGLNALDSWTVTLTANILEISAAALALSLTTGSVDTATNPDYDIVTAANAIALSHYIDNVAWVGRLSGSNKPVVIIISNALNTAGLTLTTEDKNEAVLPVTFSANYDSTDLDTPPFKIYYPKLVTDTTPPTATIAPANNATAVAVSTKPAWTFSEAIQPSAVNQANFLVQKADGSGIVAGTLSLSTDRKVVTFTPSANLTAATAYMAIAGVGIKDIAGNALAAPLVTKFTTA
jgi:hypothetical protein